MDTRHYRPEAGKKGKCYKTLNELAENSASNHDPEIDFIATTDRGYAIHVIDSTVEFPSVSESKTEDNMIVVTTYGQNTSIADGKRALALNKLEKLTGTKLIPV